MLSWQQMFLIRRRSQSYRTGNTTSRNGSYGKYFSKTKGSASKNPVKRKNFPQPTGSPFRTKQKADVRSVAILFRMTSLRSITSNLCPKAEITNWKISSVSAGSAISSTGICRTAGSGIHGYRN